MKTRYEIEIGRLVLHGVPAAQRRAVREAVEREVARRAEQGLLSSSLPVTLTVAPAGGVSRPAQATGRGGGGPGGQHPKEPSTAATPHPSGRRRSS